MVWFKGGMWHFGGKSRMRMGFPWSKHQETLRRPLSHIKFKMPRWVKVRGGTKHWWDRQNLSLLVSCALSSPPPNHHFLSFTVFLFSVYVSFCGWLNHPFTPSKFLKNKLRGDHLEERISASFLVDFPVCFTWSRSPHADRQERERGTEEKGEDDISPPSPAQRNKKKGNSIPMDPKLKKEKEKPEASSREAWWEHQSKKGIFPV